MNFLDLPRARGGRFRLTDRSTLLRVMLCLFRRHTKVRSQVTGKGPRFTVHSRPLQTLAGLTFRRPAERKPSRPNRWAEGRLKADGNGGSLVKPGSTGLMSMAHSVLQNKSWYVLPIAPVTVNVSIHLHLLLSPVKVVRSRSGKDEPNGSLSQ